MNGRISGKILFTNSQNLKFIGIRLHLLHLNQSIRIFDFFSMVEIIESKSGLQNDKMCSQRNILYKQQNDIDEYVR